jgi:hypothetical protein
MFDIHSVRRTLPRSSLTQQSGHFPVPPEPSAFAAIRPTSDGATMLPEAQEASRAFATLTRTIAAGVAAVCTLAYSGVGVPHPKAASSSDLHGAFLKIRRRRGVA